MGIQSVRFEPNIFIPIGDTYPNILKEISPYILREKCQGVKFSKNCLKILFVEHLIILLGTPQQWRLHSSKALRGIQKSFIPTVITKSSKIDYDSGEDEMLDTFLNYSSFAPFVSNST